MSVLHRGIHLVGVITLLATAAPPARAAGNVQLQLVGDARASAMAFQEWARILGTAGIQNVRIRAGEGAETVGIETVGGPGSPTYVVTGIIRSSDELELPGGRYRRTDVARLSQWLKNLAEHGPNARVEPKGPFGLSKAQFEKLRKDLARPVGVATLGLPRREATETIASRFEMPLRVPEGAVDALGDEKLTAELSGLSRGTSLAYVLGLAGYGFAPRPSVGQVTCEVVALQPGIECWPVGWPTEKLPRELVPGLFEIRNVNIQDVSAATAIDAIAKRLNMPVLWDLHAMARHGIDPAQKKVAVPRSRTTYSLALQKLLFQARLKFEIRTDEADTPLLWVTTLKP